MGTTASGEGACPYCSGGSVFVYHTGQCPKIAERGKKVVCIQKDRCIESCTHKVPHEPVKHGKFSHHSCRDEREIMCGKARAQNPKEGNYPIDGTCEEWKPPSANPKSSEIIQKENEK